MSVRTLILGAMLTLLPSCGGGGGAAPDDAVGAAPWLVDCTSEVGIVVAHETGAAGDFHMPEIMGSGAALLDVDGDGDLDLYIVNGHAALPAMRGATGNVLLRQDGDGTFTDVTEGSGLGDTGYGMGVAVADYDNDGDVDVYVTNWGPDRLFRNRGDGTFEDVTATAGVNVEGWSCSAAFIDHDRDGDLDLYVTRYVTWTDGDVCYDQAGRRDYCTAALADQTDVFLRNDGGVFVDSSAEVGIDGVARAGLGVVCADLDDDGWLDIYVANDEDANLLWHNNGDGTFTDVAPLLGVAFNLHGQVEAGMGVIAEDLDGDVDLDLFMTHLTLESNTLYRNNGVAGFADVTGACGMAGPSMPYTGFGVIAFDVEHDGDLDIALVNGKVQRAEADPESTTPAPWDQYVEPNHLYVDGGSGVYSMSAHGFDASVREASRGLAAGDIDGDGDIDLVVTSAQSPVRLYRNDAPKRGHWLIVDAVEPALDRAAVGATVIVHAGGKAYRRSIGGGCSYLCANDPRAHVGLGDTNDVDAIEVRWVDGSRERFAAGGVDRVVRVERGAGEVLP